MASEYGYKEFDAPPVRSLKARLIDSLGRPRVTVLIEDWQRCRHRSARYRSMGAPVAAINLSAGTERQWQGIRRPRVQQPQGSNPRAEAQISQWDDEAGWDHDQDEAAGHRARRLLSRSNSGFHRIGDNFAALHRWVTGERWVKRLAVVIARIGRDLRRLFRRAVVAARRRSDQSRHGDALARGRDRGQYRPRQHGRGRRHADRARRADPHRGAHPRHRRPRSRPCHRRQRAEGRSETVRHRAADGAAARRKPQSGRCRARDADHAGWHR